MTTPQLTRAIEAMTWAASVQGTANNAGCLIDSIAELRALLAQPSVAPPAPGGDVLERAYELGWRACAQWADRDDLRHDTGSVAYTGQRDALLAALQSTQAPTVQGQDAAPAEQAQGYVDCGECPRVSTGCPAGQCFRAARAKE